MRYSVWPQPDCKHGAVQGDNKMFTLTTLANPLPKFKWQFMNGSKDLSAAVTINGTVTTLHLTNITGEDFGIYCVEASNKYGTHETCCSLDSQGKWYTDTGTL